MDGADRLGRLDQHPRRPERVIQIEAVRFQLGRESAVEDQELVIFGRAHLGRFRSQFPEEFHW